MRRDIAPRALRRDIAPRALRRDAAGRHRTRAGGDLTSRRACLALPLALTACAAQGDTLPRAGPFPLPEPRTPGLRPRGGLVLDTSAWGFGGFSGLHLASDLTLTAVSDRGRWWRARLELDAAGAPRAVSGVRHGPLRDAAGAPLRGITHGDAEALTRLPDGDWLVGFERRHRLQRHRLLEGPGAPFPSPPGLTDAPSNGGLEGLTLLADGRLLALAEQLRGTAPGTTRAWLGTIAGRRVAWTPRDYVPATPMVPTGAAGLPDGGALVVERDFSLFGGFRCRLAHLPPQAFAGSGPLRGETLLHLPGDGPADNWEGVAVARHAGRTLVALISDDNERAAQRSMVLLYDMP
ncbi:esterase-like activity of phytase family protein [Roseococcus thiosulfatophilus]|uniref:esterase-like activity of phytase family protein n=1 Tax=Roseococcus thiosulfatophilus TaxID=35813 RepID=UPI001A8C973C|nr:esterase-like activity of phytase family protein [Roseococcus thiosulfatophilus]